MKIGVLEKNKVEEIYGSWEYNWLVYVYYSAANKGGGITDKECIIGLNDDGDINITRYKEDYELEEDEFLYFLVNRKITMIGKYLDIKKIVNGVEVPINEGGMYQLSAEKIEKLVK